MNDFDDFYSIVGKDVAIYRLCLRCNEICIVNPDTYDKPKTACDPGHCPHYVPICLCKDGDTLYSYAALDECLYPDCRTQRRS